MAERWKSYCRCELHRLATINSVSSNDAGAYSLRITGTIVIIITIPITQNSNSITLAVDPPPAVTAGAATGIGFNQATLPGTITATGCSPVTAYGVEISTNNGFAEGSGTQFTGSNLAGGNFSVTVSPLTQNTTYYYHTFATSSSGTDYSSQRQFYNFSTDYTLPVPSAPAILCNRINWCKCFCIVHWYGHLQRQYLYSAIIKCHRLLHKSHCYWYFSKRCP